MTLEQTLTDAERLAHLDAATLRQLVGLVPGFGWAVKGGIAYAATRAVGEAAAAYFAAGGTRLIGGSVRSRS